MKILKITNITHLLGKREHNFNSTISIEYADGFMKKNTLVKPNETIYITIDSMPISVHQLRINGSIIVSEISESELAEAMNNTKHKVVNNIINQNVEAETNQKVNNAKKHAKKPIKRR
jgi:hypothetical protein